LEEEKSLKKEELVRKISKRKPQDLKGFKNFK